MSTCLHQTQNRAVYTSNLCIFEMKCIEFAIFTNIISTDINLKCCIGSKRFTKTTSLFKCVPCSGSYGKRCLILYWIIGKIHGYWECINHIRPLTGLLYPTNMCCPCAKLEPKYVLIPFLMAFMLWSAALIMMFGPVQYESLYKYSTRPALEMYFNKNTNGIFSYDHITEQAE
eukprot:998498_1